MDLKEKVKRMPDSPGVYIMKDERALVLYVGKARSLRKRVASYFRAGRALPEKIELMTSKVADIEYIPAATEAEALIYENGLIKQLSPRYNVALRDDKSYPMLKLTVNEKFPRLFITRRKTDDGALYYGPYTNAGLLRAAVKILHEIFPLRTCSRMGKRVCLNYHISQCLGVCESKVDEARYGEMVAQIKLFLEGRKKELLGRISGKMAEAAGREDFEEAAVFKTRLDVLGSVGSKRVLYRPSGETEELKNILGIKGDLAVIEAFDISDIMGENAVGSMICFRKGLPDKSAYRKFRIKTVSGMDDYAMIREVVRRRYTRLIEEKSGIPDLVLIDGGKGHLSAAAGELEKLGLGDTPVIGIAKEFEHIYVRDRSEPIVLPKESKALHLLQRIRDEAHRFAITYHKKVSSRRMGISELDGIPGIGENRKKSLLRHFGDIEAVKNATLEELVRVEGMNEKSAKSIIGHFKRQ